jgi:hypothetical protein
MRTREHRPVDRRQQLVPRAELSGRLQHRKTGSEAVGATAIGALALGTLALGALAIGALAVGALAIGRVKVGRARVRRLEIDELVVRTIRIVGDTPDPVARLIDAQSESASQPESTDR